MRSRKRRMLVTRLKARDGDACFYCGITFNGRGKRKRTIDHLLAETHGGTHSDENCVLACNKCNNKKADTSVEVFVSSSFLQRRRRMVIRMRELAS